VRLVVDEPGSEHVREAVEGLTALVSSSLLRVESYSALAIGLRTQHLGEAQYAAAVERLRLLLEQVTFVPVKDDLIDLASTFPAKHNLKGYDSMHLAGLLASGEPGEVLFLCRDKTLRTAAEREGYGVGPASVV